MRAQLNALSLGDAMTRKLTVSACSLLLFCSLAYAQTARFVRGALVISDGTQSVRLVNAVPGDPSERVVYAVQKDGTEYFMVIGVAYTGSSSGYCGAGTEESVQWLRVRDGKIVERKEALYTSCTQHREGLVSGWQDSVLTVVTDEVLTSDPTPPTLWRHITWTYDKRRPEAAFSEEQKTYSRP